MTKPARIILGAVIALGAMYAIAAFVHADPAWAHDLFQWSKYDRAVFLYWVLTFAGSGGALGYVTHILGDSNAR